MNTEPIVNFFCPECDGDIEVNYDRIARKNPEVSCSHCNTCFKVDIDAEFDAGRWRDLTKLIAK